MTQNNKIKTEKIPVLGITGGIGSGKSEVLKYLSMKPDLVVVEADRLAHRLMEPEQPAWKRVVQVFGTEILDGDDMISRSRLGALVFGDPEKLEQLNRAVHPCVKEYILEDIRRAADEEKKLYVIEAALLVQDGYKEICDEIWSLYVPKELRIKRLMASRGGSRDKWEQITASQPDEEWFRSNTDLCIANTGTSDELLDAVDMYLERFLKG